MRVLGAVRYPTYLPTFFVEVLDNRVLEGRCENALLFSLCPFNFLSPMKHGDLSRQARDRRDEN
jgi:hypothetical protein